MVSAFLNEFTALYIDIVAYIAYYVAGIEISVDVVFSVITEYANIQCFVVGEDQVVSYEVVVQKECKFSQLTLVCRCS